VAGYETDGPSINLITITRSIGKGVPAGPETSPPMIPYLVITERDLLAAMDAGPSDDPILRVFLNIYERLVNPEFLRRVE
jgi:hypothetical protein